jgi:hypothetical protein
MLIAGANTKFTCLFAETVTALQRSVSSQGIAQDVVLHLTWVAS